MVGIELKIAGRASDASRVPRLRFGLVCVSGYRQAVPLVNELVMTPPRAELQCRTTTAVLPSLPCETRRMMPQWVRAGFVQMSPTLAFDSLQDDRPAIRSLIRMAQPASQMGPPPRIPFWCATQWAHPVPGIARHGVGFGPSCQTKQDRGDTCAGTCVTASCLVR